MTLSPNDLVDLNNRAVKFNKSLTALHRNPPAQKKYRVETLIRETIVRYLGMLLLPELEVFYLGEMIVAKGVITDVGPWTITTQVSLTHGYMIEMFATAPSGYIRKVTSFDYEKVTVIEIAEALDAALKVMEAIT